MIFRRTQRDFKTFTADLDNKESKRESVNRKHLVSIMRTTYWFLFIPVYRKDALIKSNL